MFNSFTTTLPIAEPTPALRSAIEQHAADALALANTRQRASREVLDWLRIEFGIDKPGQRLSAYQHLTTDAFATEVRKRRPKDAPPGPAGAGRS